MGNKKIIVSLLNQLRKYFSDHQKALSLIDSLEELLVSDSVSSTQGQSLNQNFDRIIKIYTDGACRGNPGPGSWAAVGLCSGKNGKDEILFEKTGVDVSTTNNRMELLGSIEALKELKNYTSIQLNDTKLELYSDSKYVVDGVKHWMSGWKKRGWKKSDGKAPENLELWQELDEVLSELTTNIEFIWVKGHVGDLYNEKCDAMANRALDDAGF